LNQDCPSEFVAFAGLLAEAAGEAIRPHFRSGLGFDDKADSSPVTIADRAAEAAIRSLIEKAYPDHGIWGEELGMIRPEAEYLWVLDPIDGTKAFLAGKPLFCTLIALMRGGVPILGVIDQPVARERWVGAGGQPTRFNGNPVQVRACAGVAAALLNCTSPLMFRTSEQQQAFAAKIAHFGGDAYGFALIASGFIDLVVEANLQLYDWAALVPVIEGAGGRMTDWQGQRLRLSGSGDVIAAGDGRVHAEALRLVRG
jgi:inositol-phosphate phosphatase / L-galactose 1-phosphate phosphatase / histidinol-phosphatase